MTALRAATPDSAGAAEPVLAWVRDYLCNPHPMLGRPGPVCPYAETALRRGTLRVFAHEGRRPDLPSLLRAHLAEFRAETRSIYDCFLVVFPDLPSSDPIDETHRRLKPEFVAEGFMIGEFHDGPPAKPGLWNPEWRPLRSPVPLLAIRRMVPTDLPFLTGDPRYVAAYESRFGAARRAPDAERIASHAART